MKNGDDDDDGDNDDEDEEEDFYDQVSWEDSKSKTYSCCTY